MSHFSVLVPAQDANELEQKMLPYHEYESTGIEEYVKFVPADMDELRKDYEKHGDGQALEEFAEEWAGYVKNEEGVLGRRTNPDAKWDYFRIGGRWSGRLPIKPEKERVGVVSLGPRGYDSPAMIKPDRADTALVGDVDWEKMRSESFDNLRMRWERWQRLEGEPDENGYKPDLGFDFGMLDKYEAQALNGSLEDYLEKYGLLRSTTWAYIDLEGKWHERANMGWFGISWDEQEDYPGEFWEFIESLPDDQRVYVVDCHI